jgi:imidazolonepropionase-like amidohydrolase
VFTPLEAISVAIRETADLLGPGCTGAFAPGKEANVLVVERDPLENIMDLARPWLVMRQGKLIRRPGCVEGAIDDWMTP